MISLSLAQCSSLGCTSWQNQWTEDEEQARADSTLAGSDEVMRTQSLDDLRIYRSCTIRARSFLQYVLGRSYNTR